MTKADLVEQVAEAIGPGITKKDCALVVDGQGTLGPHDSVYLFDQFIGLMEARLS